MIGKIQLYNVIHSISYFSLRDFHDICASLIETLMFKNSSMRDARKMESIFFSYCVIHAKSSPFSFTSREQLTWQRCESRGPRLLWTGAAARSCLPPGPHLPPRCQHDPLLPPASRSRHLLAWLWGEWLSDWDWQWLVQCELQSGEGWGKEWWH